VWEIFRALYQMTKKPLLVRGLALMTGYLWAAMRRVDRPVSAELRAFRRKEQMRHLAGLVFRSRAGSGHAASPAQFPAKLPH
jgi:hypothetical protein